MSRLLKLSLNSLYKNQSVRHLSLQEHKSFALLNEYHIPTPRFGVTKDPKEASQIAKDLECSDYVVKAQVLAGGRGAGHFKDGLHGGVQIVHSPEQVTDVATKMIGQVLVTKQTGPEGKICNSVMIAQRKYPKREFYIGIMMDRMSNGPVLIASGRGGINIEEVAANSPNEVIKEKIDIEAGLTTEQITRVANFIGLKRNLRETVRILQNLHCLFLRNDALLVEINPYAEDVCECFYALDAKMVFDDNAEYRQKELFAKRDVSQENCLEVAAHKADLSYISMDGNIGCMVNGAGLAMATMDIIKLHGGSPANFLDFQGPITTEKVEKAFEIVTCDKNVQVIYMNIFGGIARCDEIVKGIISVTKKMNMNIPVVVRLQGTNEKEAKELIKTSNIKIIPMDDFNESADLSVKISKIVDLANQSNLDVGLQIKDALAKKTDACKKAICPDSSKKADKKPEKDQLAEKPKEPSSLSFTEKLKNGWCSSQSKIESSQSKKVESSPASLQKSTVPVDSSKKVSTPSEALQKSSVPAQKSEKPKENSQKVKELSSSPQKSTPPTKNEENVKKPTSNAQKPAASATVKSTAINLSSKQSTADNKDKIVSDPCKLSQPSNLSPSAKKADSKDPKTENSKKSEGVLKISPSVTQNPVNNQKIEKSTDSKKPSEKDAAVSKKVDQKPPSDDKKPPSNEKKTDQKPPSNEKKSFFDIFSSNSKKK